TGHLHEREVSHHLGQAIRFAPHVAPFFRGITTTIMARLKRPIDPIELSQLYEHFYANHHLIKIRPDEIPFVRDATNSPQATIGGLTIDENNPCHVSLVVTLDNLLKGAASQAIQNINLASGFDPMEGLTP
ncbi:MAG: Asd/ArgC dimerization domain-containing protein, partial [Planctomycetota bacterium]|nr:Asd/ArgC dimerization domain-containing protein [Planctomycetota bacterium]